MPSDGRVGGVDVSLAVFLSVPTFFQPAKRSLDDPPLRDNFEHVQFVALGYLHRHAQERFDGACEGCASVSAIVQHVDHII